MGAGVPRLATASRWSFDTQFSFIPTFRFRKYFSAEADRRESVQPSGAPRRGSGVGRTRRAGARAAAVEPTPPAADASTARLHAMSPLPLLLSMLVLAAHEQKCRAVEFQPLAIPEAEWRPHEPSSAAAPTRYWEDALRHSVYLTLVRDKIDELIAHGADGPPDAGQYDLWDKIKDASFQRLAIEEPTTHGDVTLMARGRLFEDKEKFQFVEDETKGKICKEPTCMKGVKALWSVKRTRQRDQDPGNYRYELTFSVITRIHDGPKNQYNSPARTFTVREMIPDIRIENFSQNASLKSVEAKKSPRVHDGQAVWFHKNIIPLQQQTHRLPLYDPDRIFSSFFTDDAPDVWKPPTQQYSKVGYMGLSSNQQRKTIPYNYTPYKTTNLGHHGRSPSQSAVPYSLHKQLEKDIVVVSHPYQSPDQKHKSSPQFNPTRTPFLPTPLSTVLLTDKMLLKKNITNKLQQSTNVTRTTDITPAYVKSKPSLLNMNYVTEHIRPPVYNTPPGVFATMDKKPFKPMPPLRIQSHSKTKKPSRPLDFRPSPQVIDLEFSGLNPLSDSAFRPVNPFANIVSKETNGTINNTLKSDSEHIFKITEQKKFKEKATARNQKNNTNISATTTGQMEQNLESMTWANVLGAFSKTTPMESEKETIQATTTFATNTVKVLPSNPQNISTTTTPKTTATTTATRHTTITTPASKRRQMRPSYKSKNKKYKTISTTTERLSTNQTFSEIDSMPAYTAGGTVITAATIDSTTQMTTAINSTLPFAATAETSSTTEAVHLTTYKTTKVSNRYRQSTLMRKGTSAKRDKLVNLENKSVIKSVMPSTSLYPSRRNASNFQGHDVTVTENSPINESTAFYVTTTEQAITDQTPATQNSISEITDENNDKNPTPKQINSDFLQYSGDFNTVKTDIMTAEDDRITSDFNQVMSNTLTTPLPHLESKNKTKCKKRKHNNITNKDIRDATSDKIITSTTESATTIDIFDEIFNGLSYMDTTSTNTSSNETLIAEDYDYTEEASINKKHGMLDSIDLGSDEHIYHNIHHKADYENNNGEHSAEAEYYEEVEKEANDSESGEGGYHDSQEKDTPYDVFQLLINETNQQLQLVA